MGISADDGSGAVQVLYPCCCHSHQRPFLPQERLAADPYLETREKEDAFLQRVQEAVERGIQSANANSLGNLAALLQGVRPAAPTASGEMTDADFDTAMDFINGL